MPTLEWKKTSELDTRIEAYDVKYSTNDDLWERPYILSNEQILIRNWKCLRYVVVYENHSENNTSIRVDLQVHILHGGNTPWISKIIQILSEKVYKDFS